MNWSITVSLLSSVDTTQRCRLHHRPILAYVLPPAARLYVWRDWRPCRVGLRCARHKALESDPLFIFISNTINSMHSAPSDFLYFFYYLPWLISLCTSSTTLKSDLLAARRFLLLQFLPATSSCFVQSFASDPCMVAGSWRPLDSQWVGLSAYLLRPSPLNCVCSIRHFRRHSLHMRAAWCMPLVFKILLLLSFFASKHVSVFPLDEP